MSVNVLIIPEDFVNDQYILKPIVEAMFAYIGKPRTRVKVCQKPRLGGIDQATDWERIEQIMDLYPMTHLYLLLVDRDSEEGRRKKLDRIETKAAEILPGNCALFAENAWQEVEVWLLAGHDLPEWQKIRAEKHAKEIYYEPFARQRGVIKGLGQGRDTLAREAAGRYGRVRQLCPELAELETRIQTWLSAIE